MKRITRHRNHGRCRRRGMIAIFALTTMVVVTSLVLLALQSGLHQRRFQRMENRIEQTRWLLDAGIRAAMIRLDQAPGYDGETITIPGGLGDTDQAMIRIVVSPAEEGTDRRVLVEASLRSSSNHHPPTLRSFVFELPDPRPDPVLPERQASDGRLLSPE